MYECIYIRICVYKYIYVYIYIYHDAVFGLPSHDVFPWERLNYERHGTNACSL